MKNRKNESGPDDGGRGFCKFVLVGIFAGEVFTRSRQKTTSIGQARRNVAPSATASFATMFLWIILSF